MARKLDEMQELALRQFVDAEGGKEILDVIISGIVNTKIRSYLTLNPNDEAADRRLLSARHELTGAELLQRGIMVELEKYAKPPKAK